MIRVGVVGATGYTGEKLIEILLGHPQVRVTYVSAKIDKKQEISKIFPRFAGRINLSCDNLDITQAVKSCDLLFLAVPHKVSMEIAPALLKANKTVIDLSADYRLSDIEEYKNWYGLAHRDKKNLKSAVYGLPELYREKIKGTKLVANPGCYPTAAILGLAPVLATDLVDIKSIIIDAKSGVTGAGRKASLDFFFSEINENLKAYKINMHQHMPEIDQFASKIAQKKVKVSFVPHLVPMNRGILETIYVKLTRQKTEKEILSVYNKFYKTEEFVRVYDAGRVPQTKDVLGTNYCDIGLKLIKEKNMLVVVVAIDNLMKGAASQAVQNMNIIYKFKESLGLK